MRKAFTLVELLVVVSIIALLIAILLPALSNARYTAQVAQCKVVLRGIATVQSSYAVDNKDFFPEAGYRYGSAGEAGSWWQAR
ncbi:MAG: type II secretion system protein, partial [Phycisphaeraceae bacterium]